MAPTQFAPIITSDGGNRKLKPMRWGLIPSWAPDDSFASKMINARSETLAEKPSFRKLIDRSRVMIPADGFFEWRDFPNGKRGPIRIALKTGEPFAFAGLSDKWKKPDGSELETFTIITTSANELISPLHDRMPVILPREAEEVWLDLSKSGAKAVELLKPYSADAMEYFSVSTLVNKPVNDSPACIERVADPVA